MPRKAAKGINPVQHSERSAGKKKGGKKKTAAKGINPVQHSERSSRAMKKESSLSSRSAGTRKGGKKKSAAKKKTTKKR